MAKQELGFLFLLFMLNLNMVVKLGLQLNNR
jgi:hypothetical protein